MNTLVDKGDNISYNIRRKLRFIMINTEAQNELTQHLYNINAEAKANGSPFEIVTDLAHWAKYEVYSVEDFEHYDARAEYWDLYKSVNGVRPRWVNFDEMTTEEIREDIRDLQAQLEYEVEAESKAKEEHEARWKEAFEESSLENRLDF
jgi:hypothetical protein